MNTGIALRKVFVINQKARSLNVINRSDGANFPAVYVCLPPINDVLGTL